MCSLSQNAAVVVWPSSLESGGCWGDSLWHSVTLTVSLLAHDEPRGPSALQFQILPAFHCPYLFHFEIMDELNF